MNLNQKFAARLEALGIAIPELLMPASGIDLAAWSVVACDQYTSDHDYWRAVEDKVGQSPSTLRLTLPEIHLESPDVDRRITAIHQTMDSYLKAGVLQPAGPAFVYVERTTAASGLRQGLLMAMDLERYSYAPDSRTLIRATEGTIVDRIPPRLAVRRTAGLELPHIMILIQDPAKALIEGLAARKAALRPAYSVELMQHGGHLAGWFIESESETELIIKGLEGLLASTKRQQGTDQPLFWAMGDGNHSLATAKASWEAIKAAHLKEHGSLDGLAGHPARYALAEIVNIHSPGLRFEPINRAVFTDQARAMVAMLEKNPDIASVRPISEQDLGRFLASPEGQAGIGCFDGVDWKLALLRPECSRLPPALVDQAFAEYRTVDAQAKIDFIHGWEDTRKLCTGGAACFFLPVIARERLFDHVQKNGPLPRKAFSMGDAEEKRYYLEARRIQP